MKTISRTTIYQLLFNQEFNKSDNWIDEVVSFEFLNSSELQITDNSTGFNKLVEVYEGEVFTSEGEVICTVRDLNLFTDFNEKNVCQECYGEGYVEVGPICSKPASMCCGGCYQRVECECELPYNYCD